MFYLFRCVRFSVFVPTSPTWTWPRPTWQILHLTGRSFFFFFLGASVFFPLEPQFVSNCCRPSSGAAGLLLEPACPSSTWICRAARRSPTTLWGNSPSAWATSPLPPSTRTGGTSTPRVPRCPSAWWRRRTAWARWSTNGAPSFSSRGLDAGGAAEAKLKSGSWTP